MGGLLLVVVGLVWSNTGHYGSLLGRAVANSLLSFILNESVSLPSKQEL